MPPSLTFNVLFRNKGKLMHPGLLSKMGGAKFPSDKEISNFEGPPLQSISVFLFLHLESLLNSTKGIT